MASGAGASALFQHKNKPPLFFAVVFLRRKISINSRNWHCLISLRSSILVALIHSAGQTILSWPFFYWFLMCFFYWVASLIWKDMTELWMVVVRILVGPARSIFYFCPSPTKDSATRVVCYSLINTEGGVTTTDSSTNTHTHSHAHRVHCLVLKRPFSERPLPVRLGSEFVSFPRLWTSPPPASLSNLLLKNCAIFMDYAKVYRVLYGILFFLVLQSSWSGIGNE